jgi:hypothetical protein
LSAMLMTTSTLARAAPLKVEPVGGETQRVIMCPKCEAPIACAKAGDYTLAFTADLQDPALLRFVRLAVRVTDSKGKPVNDAKVKVALWMADHPHEVSPPMAVDSQGNGLYAVSTGRLAMGGIWYAEVRLSTPRGDTVTRQFRFHQPIHTKPYPPAADSGGEKHQ